MTNFSPFPLRRLLLPGLLLLGTLAARAQGVGIGTTTPNASAALDISSTTKGLLPPRMTQAQRNAINPASTAAGLTVFNTTTGVLNTWDGAKWVAALADTTPPPTATFTYTGAAQTYPVPAGVTAVAVDLVGAAGGPANGGGGAGLGGRVQATLAVTPGQVLTIYVGQVGGSPTGGYNGGGTGDNVGGGGGASDVRAGGAALSNRVLVAGGGGGGGYTATTGGNGGGLSAQAGADYSGGGSGGGSGGTATAGGAGGSSYGYTGSAGSAGSGGGGNYVAGGGGGGYYGGGGGAYGSGGGGGSSYAGTGTSAVTHTQGYQGGNGYVTIMPAPPATLPAPFLDASNISGVIRNQTSQQVGANFNIGGNGIVGGNASVGGNMGIGTATPGALLHLYGGQGAGDLLFGRSGISKASSIQVLDDGSFGGGLTFKVHASTGSDNWPTGTSTAMTIRPNGNVGIGTDSPGQKLEVTGTIFSSVGGFRFPDGTILVSGNLTGDITSTGAATSYAGIVPATKGGAGTVSGILKANGSGTVSQAGAGTDYLAPTGSAAGLTNFPTFNQNTTGSAATVTTNANLTGDITSTGNATTYAGIVPATKGGAGTVSGLLKANGVGVVSAATAGTDYAAATGSTAYVQNNATATAQSASFNVSGSGTIGGSSTVGTRLSVGASAPAVAPLNARGAGNAFPATSGTAQSAGLISRLQTSNNLVLDLGGNSSNGAWLQSTDATSLSTNYPLLLNPNGGNVGIGTAAPATRLDVNGNLRLAVRLCPANTSASYTLTAADVAFSIFKVQNGSYVNPLVLPDATAGQVEGQELSILNLATNGTSVSATNTDNTTAVALAAAGATGSHAVKYVWAVAASGSGYWVRVQ